ncbi:MAG: hypothetical protein KF865_15160 [Bdellovibrionaceae bacterium]|nr:hypothetical protein [Pseudobdellovibrionaceae bacterium]
MVNQDVSQPKADVLNSAMKLAHLLKTDISGLDKSEYDRGDRILSFYVDTQFGANFRNLNEMKIEVLTNVIEDLADRARMLSKAFFGVSFVNNQMESFVCDHGQRPKGNLVFKVSLKDVAAFQRWRAGQEADVQAEDLHAAIYRATVEWSRSL